MGTGHRPRIRRWIAVAGIGGTLLLAGCSGPDQFGAGSAVPTATPTVQVELEPTPSPEPSPTPDETATPEPEPTVEPTPTAVEEPTPTPEPDPTPEPEATEEAPEPTAEAQPPPPMEALPGLDELSDAGFIVAAQGDRTADQLAGAYIDPAAHLARLEEWGFQQHVYREFTRPGSGENDTLPTYIMATINVYGSAEQADLALRWLEDHQASQGASIVEGPEVGEAAVAMTQPTSTGEAAAWSIFRVGERVYVYYAQGGDPLAEVNGIATRVFERLSGGENGGETV